MKNTNKASLASFLRLPRLDIPWNQKIVCRYVEVVPTTKIHESGWRKMFLVPVFADGVRGRLETRQDDIELLPSDRGWHIQSERGSGVFGIWSSSRNVEIGTRLSTVELRSTNDDAQNGSALSVKKGRKP